MIVPLRHCWCGERAAYVCTERTPLNFPLQWFACEIHCGEPPPGEHGFRENDYEPIEDWFRCYGLDA